MYIDVFDSVLKSNEKGPEENISSLAVRRTELPTFFWHLGKMPEKSCDLSK